MAQPQQSPFVVDSVTPRALTGQQREGTYALNAASIHPTVIVGRDARGKPIEETRPPAYSERWVHPNGCVNWVPMRTGVVFSTDPSAERYQVIQTRDLILDGWLPLWSCPHSHEFVHIAGGPLVPLPPGEQPCGGDPDARDPNKVAKGCKHLQAVIKLRREYDAEEFKQKQVIASTFKPEEVKALMQGAAQTFAETLTSDPVKEMQERKRGLAKGT